jgi:hypothetical protein
MVMSQSEVSQEGRVGAVRAPGKRQVSARALARTVNLVPPGEKSLSGNGHTGRAGRALQRLRDDEVLGCGDEANDATRRKAAWRQVALNRARRARHELLSAWAMAPPGQGRDRWGEEAAELVLKAKASALQPVSLWSWLEGCYQEQAWLSLHEADAQIIEVLPLEGFLARTDGVLAKARRVLGAEDPRIKCIESLLACEATPEAKLRPRVAQLSRATFDALDDRYAQSRGYRNRLIRLTSLAVMGIVIGLVAGTMSKLDFGLTDRANLTGWKTLLMVLLFGSMGALVTAIPPLAKANGTRNPFGLPMFQLLLKLAMGPLFAVVGVLILQAQLITGLKPAADLRTLLVWATLFGAAQQSVTRFIDQRVTGLLGEASMGPPSKGAAAKTAQH